MSERPYPEVTTQQPLHTSTSPPPPQHTLQHPFEHTHPHTAVQVELVAERYQFQRPPPRLEQTPRCRCAQDQAGSGCPSIFEARWCQRSVQHPQRTAAAAVTQTSPCRNKLGRCSAQLLRWATSALRQRRTRRRCCRSWSRSLRKHASSLSRTVSASNPLRPLRSAAWHQGLRGKEPLRQAA